METSQGVFLSLINNLFLMLSQSINPAKSFSYITSFHSCIIQIFDMSDATDAEQPVHRGPQPHPSPDSIAVYTKSEPDKSLIHEGCIRPAVSAEKRKEAYLQKERGEEARPQETPTEL